MPVGSPAEVSTWLLTDQRDTWITWRCGVFTDWVREFREIVDAERPNALLGTFHCPWTEEEFGGALRGKLAIDLEGQAPYLDVFSIMPYHARFGHAADPEWIYRQVAWLGRYLGLTGATGERNKIWPIVQIADWGESVPVEQVETIIEHGSRLPATGIMVFAWHGLKDQDDKQRAVGRAYRLLERRP